MRALLDTNIILDAILGRVPWGTVASIIWAAAQARVIECFVTASSLTDIFFVSNQLLHRSPIAGLDARQVVRRCLDSLAMIPVGRDDLERAYQLGGRDFEDDLQRACAEFYRLDAIVTRDRVGFRGSVVPVYAPDAFVQHLIQTGLVSPSALPQPPAGGPTP